MRQSIFAQLHKRWPGLKPRRLWLGVAALQVLALVFLYLNWPPVVLTLLVPEEEQQGWQTLIQTFQAQHPKTKIRLISRKNLGGYLTKQLKEGNCEPEGAPKDAPDLVYIDVIWVPEFAVKGCLKDLTAHLTPQLKAQFAPQTLEDGEYDGKLYRIPLRSDVGMLYYRFDLLNRGGYQHPPKTFAELLEISQTLKQKKLAEWGFLWQGDQYEGLIATFVEVLAGYGGYWVDPETSAVGLDQPQAIQAVQFLRNTLRTKVSPSSVFTLSEKESLEQFKAGKTVFLRHWPRARALLEASDSNVVGKVKAVPLQLQTNGHQGKPCNGSWGLGIADKTQHFNQAWQAVRFFTSEKAQRQFTRETRFMPSQKAVLEQEPPEIQQAAANAVDRPRIPEYDQASEILQAALSQALNPDLPDQDVERIMQMAAEETYQILPPPA